MVTMVVGAAAAAALQLHLKVLGGAHWQLPLLLLIMMLPAALHLRSMHGRDHLEFFKPLVGYLVAYLSAFVAFYILDSFGDSVLSNMTGRLGGP